MKQLCAIAFSCSLLLVRSSVLSASSPVPKSFLEWCTQSEEFSPEALHTVKTLLDIAGTQDCQAASDILAETTQLDLTNRQIIDLSPLASLTQLTILYAGQNQISDINPLTDLVNLTELHLPNNTITDISPIAQLSRLDTLYLDNNEIQDISAVSDLRSLTVLYANNNRIQSLDSVTNLTHLTQLFVAHNQISNLTPLTDLERLAYLNVGHNRVADVDGLSTLPELVELDISDNQITQVNALANLQNLNQLDLRNNPLMTQACPVFPATICIFSDAAADLYQAGEAQLEQGDFNLALNTFQDALEVYQATGDRLRESDALDRLGNVYDAQGEYANSLDHYQQAAVIREQVGDRQGESETLTNLGITYIRLGQNEKAIELLEQAIDMHRELVPRDRSWLRQTPQEENILSGLALVYSQQENHAQALRFAKLSLAGYRQNNDTSGEAIALVRVGTAYLKLGDINKARLYLTQALQLSEAIDDQPSIAGSLKALGDLSVATGDTAIALNQYQQALDAYTLDNPAGAGKTLNAMGKLLLETEQPQAASEALAKTVTLWESLRPGLTDENKISIAETQAETYQLLQRSLIELENIAAGLEVSERGRARAFTELLVHRLSLRGQAAPTESLDPPNIQAIRQIAQEQQATLVEYSQVGDDLYIWVVSPEGELQFARQSLIGKPIADWVTEFRQALVIPGRGLGVEVVGEQQREIAPATNNLNQLHELLIAPIADFLPTDPDATVVIIPQGDLFLVPFPALIDNSGTVLIEKHPLLFAPAINLLAINSTLEEPLRIGSDPAVVVGNPVMPKDPTSGLPLSPLVGAELEALEVAAILNTEPLTREAATKSAVVNEMSDAKIIHLATHGLLDDFGTGIPGILAFAPTAGDSGYLTAAEILDMTLTAQLAVLSACDTAQGHITGDGVIGLSRSLLTAGVDSVVVTLWSIPDDATAILMGEFYRELQETPNRAIALRNAMLTTRQNPDHAHPYKWAAFSLYGHTGK
ncbi:CHAT domain-containing protein [Oscillatoria sp. CS-180]|uniref:CHAT domain-containing protein n=1 Tax=Oscillatoria sp. CS-180 TaxID=3021720 RepID=UPI00232DDDD6|nr:CHAT domain-containing protein [Oscillatoria sp. CS-180]MDB9525262.1 CHAT domain-containing protein [Oscillatoria sp. CS-180]